MPKRSFTLEDISNLPLWFKRATPQALFSSEQVTSLFEYSSKEALVVACRRGLFPKATKNLDTSVSSGSITRLFWSKRDLLNYISTLII